LFDVAVSFLSIDEPLAVELSNELSKNLSVFVYSKRQEELAGTDGLKSFRQTFLSKSKLVVVLYRDGWGSTRWTAVEEMAIKDRMFNGGWRSLLFVTLDEGSTLPNWLPESHIRLNYSHYRGSLIGAIKMRAEELGSVLRAETAIEKAKRTQSNELARAERDRLLMDQGTAAIQTEHQMLRHQFGEKIAEIQPHLSTITLTQGSDGHEYIVRTERASISFNVYVTFPVTESRIIVQEFDRPLILPQDRGRRGFFPGEEPRQISKREFYFDYKVSHGWCWKQHSSSSELLTTPEVCEYLIKRVLEVHEQVKTGKRDPRPQRYGPNRQGIWS
jgi:hypothetical protein